MPTMGLLSLIDPVEPKNPARPKLKMPPSVADSQYPPAGGAGGGGGGVAGAGWPVPDSETSWWPSGAESLKGSVATRAPGPAGVKVSDTLHVPPPPATVVPLQVSVVLVKSPGL